MLERNLKFTDKKKKTTRSEYVLRTCSVHAIYIKKNPFSQSNLKQNLNVSFSVHVFCFSIYDFSTQKKIRCGILVCVL